MNYPKVVLTPKCDSHNTYDPPPVEFQVDSDEVTIHPDNRDVTFDKKDFEVLALLFRHRGRQ